MRACAQGGGGRTLPSFGCVEERHSFKPPASIMLWVITSDQDQGVRLLFGCAEEENLRITRDNQIDDALHQPPGFHALCLERGFILIYLNLPVLLLLRPFTPARPPPEVPVQPPTSWSLLFKPSLPGRWKLSLHFSCSAFPKAQNQSRSFDFFPCRT